MNFINDNANIFFFVTTIFVVVLIVIFLILLFATIRIYRFIRKAVNQGDVLLEETKTSEFVKKGAPIVLPILLPILSFFFKSKKTRKGK